MEALPPQPPSCLSGGSMALNWLQTGSELALNWWAPTAPKLVPNWPQTGSKPHTIFTEIALMNIVCPAGHRWAEKALREVPVVDTIVLL